MPKCRFCNENITKFDKEICPYCGSRKPLEDVDVATNDITQVLSTQEEKKKVSYKEHSKVINAVFAFTLGMFGANFFYLGFLLKGFLRLFIGLLISAGLFVLFFIAIPLGLPIALAIAIGANFLVGIIQGIYYLSSNTLKDASGVLLK